MAPKETKYDAIQQKYDHDQIRSQFREERLLYKDKSELAQLPESLYAIREKNGRISKLAFLAKKDFEASQRLTEYLFSHRKKKQDEVFILYRLGTYDPDNMTFNPEVFPVVIKSSDDAKNIILR